MELAPEEVQLIVNSLAYDMKIEKVRGGILGSLGVRRVALHHTYLIHTLLYHWPLRPD